MVHSDDGLFIVAQPLHRLRLQHLRISRIENVKFLLVLVLQLHLFHLILVSRALLPVLLQRWNVIDHSDCPGTIDTRGNTLLPDSQVVLFKLIQIFELTLELSGHQQVLRLLMNMEQIVVVILELVELDLVEA